MGSLFQKHQHPNFGTRRGTRGRAGTALCTQFRRYTSITIPAWVFLCFPSKSLDLVLAADCHLCEGEITPYNGFSSVRVLTLEGTDIPPNQREHLITVLQGRIDCTFSPSENE